MRRLTSIWLFLCVAASVFAVNASPCQSSPFYSTSAYIASPPPPAATTNVQRPIGSVTTISASNFATLNGEGGEFYQPAATRPQVRKGRPGGGGGDSGGGAIGEYDFHSPVGNIPWIVFALMAAAYLFVKRRKIRTEQ